jgi:hypothetical protein
MWVKGYEQVRGLTRTPYPLLALTPLGLELVPFVPLWGKGVPG